MESKVAVLDGGSQYIQKIDRCIRELGVCSDLLPIDTPFETLKDYGALIISGGPKSVTDTDAPKCDPLIFESNIPILGICYGMQLINYVHGGIVEKKTTREDGQTNIQLIHESALFASLERDQKVLLTHGDSVGMNDIAPEFKSIALSHDIIVALEHDTKKIYGVQFHPEVDLTVNGKTIFSNFLFGIAGLQPNYTIDDRKTQIIQEIRERVGDKKVLVLISGGVDSTVCCALLHHALGNDKIYGLHIDTGFMRKGESALVYESLRKLGFEMKIVDTTDIFLNGQTHINGIATPKLSETVHPETKRKIIGDVFMKIVDQEIATLGWAEDEYFIAQGTLRPDLIESASAHAQSSNKNADTIKTHHNDTQLVREKRARGLVLEPLSSYHKDETRQLGLKLGLPKEAVFRQPFPGPGLAIRILCQNATCDAIDDELTRQVAEFETDELGLVVLPVLSVGIQGDARTYSHAVGIYSKNSVNDVDWTEIMHLAKTIPQSVNVNRVVYMIDCNDTTKMANVPTMLDAASVDLLRNVEYDINQILNNAGIMSKFSQVPIVLLPVSLTGDSNRSIVIRTFITNDFMTGLPGIPDHDFDAGVLMLISIHIKQKFPISCVMYDLTGKPPATTEWE